MKAIVLAAGEGTRMMPLTKNTAKPMLKVLGKPILEYNLESIHDFVDEIIMVVGYFKEQIEEYFKDDFKGVPVKYVEQKVQLGTGHAVISAEKFIDDDRFIIMLGDDFVTRDVIEKAVSHNLSLVAKKVDNPKIFGIVEVDKDNNIRGIEEKPKKPKTNFANTGLWVMNKKLIDLMHLQEKSDRGEYELPCALKELIKTDKVYCELVDDGWISIGYPEDLKKLEEHLKVK